MARAGKHLHGRLLVAALLASSVLSVGTSADGNAAEPKPFEEIMTSVAAAGSVSNGDGHRWTFRKNSNGSWEVEGARGNRAKVTDAGPDKINIKGFPRNWGANGDFVFSSQPGECLLKSDHSRHRIQWDC